MKKMRLTIEEQTLLVRAPVDLLGFFVEISQNKHFPLLVKFVNQMIDLEKNVFFGSKEFDPGKLAVEHAYARGGIAKLASLLRMISAAEHERNKRKEAKE